MLLSAASGVRKRGRRLLLLLATAGCLLVIVWLSLPAWYASRIESALYLHDLQTAKSWIDQGLWFAPQDSQLLRYRARYSRKLSRFDEMNRDLQAALKNGMSRDLLKLEQMLAGAQTGELRPLQSELGSLLAESQQQPEICDAYVRGCLQLYRIEDAQQMLQMWQTDFPDDPNSYFLRGRMLEHESDMKGAEEQFRYALRLSPHHAPAAYNLARVLFTQYEYEAAIGAYEQAEVALWNRYPCRLGIAECFVELEQFEQADEILQTISSDSPQEQLEIFRYLGDPQYLAASRYDSVKGRLALATEEYELAVTSFARALEQNPQDWRTRLQYSIALKQAGQVEAGRVQAEQVAATQQALQKCDVYIRRVRENPADLAARVEIGQIMYEHVSEFQGRIWIQSALNIDPNYQPALDFLREQR